MAPIQVKDEWKCSYQESGEQCVMMTGMTEMPVLCVDSWDFQLLASDLHQNDYLVATILFFL